MNVKRKLLRIVFDIAIESLDFGSGFLDDEEVETLRTLAVELGVDPWLATPCSHQPKYCPGHEWSEWKHSDYRGRYRTCSVCNATDAPDFVSVQSRTLAEEWQEWMTAQRDEIRAERAKRLSEPRTRHR